MDQIGEKTYGGIVIVVILENLLDRLGNVWLIVLLNLKCQPNQEIGRTLHAQKGIDENKW